MPTALHVACGALPALALWIALRREAGAGLRGPLLWLDALPIAMGFLLGVLGTGRPVLTAVLLSATGAGLMLSDRVKRAVLDEPVVFADRSELIELVRHPIFYLPFAGTGRVLAGGAAAMLAVGALSWAEPPVWPASASSMLTALGLGVACFVLPTWPPLLHRLAAAYARLPLAREPAQDAALLGILGCFIVHATLARAERPARQRAARERPWPALPRDAGPIVVVQSESFMDVRRLHPSLGDAALPGWAGLCRGASLRGRLAVPAWGANTVRTEFAVLSGLDEAALGLDRFNPYAAFARTELPSLARAAKAAGYRTVCVHPFDLGFYGRRQVLPLLGFDVLVGPEAFRGAARFGAWVGDPEVARVVADVVRREGPDVFVFAITMQNHGPWDAGAPAPGLEGVVEAGPLGQYLMGVREADRVISVLTGALGDGWLLIYGDHQPSLPGALHALGVEDRRTDYAIWSARGGAGARQDLAAHELGRALLAAIAPAVRAGAA